MPVAREPEDLDHILADALAQGDVEATETGTDAQGQPFERTGKAIEVVRRQPNGSWRYVFDDPYGRG